MTQQQFTSLQSLIETLSANVGAGILLICLVVSLSVLLFAYTGYKRQQNDGKKVDASDLVLQRMAELEKQSRDRETAAQNELLRQREVNAKQRQIIDEQIQTAKQQAAITEQNLQAIKDHNQLLSGIKKMAEERDAKMEEDITQVKVNLADGVSIAEENNTLAKESVELARDTNEAVKVLDAKLDKLPDTTAQVVAHTLEPIQDEFESVSEKLQGLTNVVKEQPDLAGKVDTLISQMTEVQQTLKEIREAVKPPKNETPTLPSKPEDLKP